MVFPSEVFLHPMMNHLSPDESSVLTPPHSKGTMATEWFDEDVNDQMLMPL